MVDEIIAPFDTSAKFRFYVLNADAAQPQHMTLPAPSGELFADNLMFRAPQGERLLIAGVSLQLDAGESKYITMTPGFGVVVGRIVMSVEPAQTARTELASMSYVGTAKK